MVLSTYPWLSSPLWVKCGPEIDTRRLSGDWQPGFGLLECCCRLNKMTDNLADDIFRCNFVNENIWMLNKISSKYVWECQIDNKSTLIRVTAWRRAGDKPSPEPMDALVSDIFRSPPVRISRCGKGGSWLSLCIEFHPFERRVILQSANGYLCFLYTLHM